VTDTAPDTPEQRLAAVLARVREGWPLVRACRSLGVSYDTIWRWRRTKPEFAAALAEAEQIGADVRKSWREDDTREQYSAHVLEMAEKHEREDAPSQRDYTGRPTRRERRLLAKLHGVNTSLFPGRSPSNTRESDDLLERMGQRMTRAQMRESFAKRAAEKRAGLAGNATESPAGPTPSGPPRKGKAGVLF
jgi:hypothetical protein